VTLAEHLNACAITPLRKQYLSLSPQQLQALEVQVGPLPIVYRELVSNFGGAVFDKEVVFSVMDHRFRRISPTGTATIDCIYGDVYNNDPWDPSSLQANIEWMKGRMPDTMIPIAASTQDHVCLCLRGEDRNALFYWDRVEEPTVNGNNIYRIANSLSEFILGLTCEV